MRRRSAINQDEKIGRRKGRVFLNRSRNPNRNRQSVGSAGSVRSVGSKEGLRL